MATEKSKAPQNQGKINDGYNDVHEVDPVGYWDEEAGPCYFIPKYAKVFDGNIEKAKPAVLIMGTLTASTQLYVGKGDEQETFQGKEGDFIAVWGKPGMAALKNMCGIPVKLWQEGEKDTGKPNAMKLYKVATKGAVNESPLPIQEDTRDKSFGVTTFLEQRGVRKNRPQGSRPSSDTNGDAGDDNVNF